MRCPRSSAENARKRKRPTNSPQELDAEMFWAPARACEDEYELPDWVAGAN